MVASLPLPHARSSTTQQLTHAHIKTKVALHAGFKSEDVVCVCPKEARYNKPMLIYCFDVGTTSTQHWLNVELGGGRFCQVKSEGKSWLIRPVRGSLDCGAKRQYLLILQVSKYCLWLCRAALSGYIRRHVRQLLSYLRHAINTTTCGAGCKWICTRIF